MTYRVTVTASDPRTLVQRAELARCAEVVARLAEHRAIEPVHVSKVRYDRQIRKVLASVVRLYTRLISTSYFSDAARAGGARVHRDHIVPVRALVDRMIMNPDETLEILDAVVLAEISAEEQKQLGGIWKHHEDVYAAMLQCPPGDLVNLGLKRYVRSGVQVQAVML